MRREKMMFHLPKSTRIALAAGTIAVIGSLGATAPAAAQWGGHHGGYGHHEHHGGWGGGWRGPRPYYRPYQPVYGGFYAGGPRCFVKRKWVPGPFGWHWASRRICRW
jgi:hypothetical protein